MQHTGLVLRCLRTSLQLLSAGFLGLTGTHAYLAQRERKAMESGLTGIHVGAGGSETSIVTSTVDESPASD